MVQRVERSRRCRCLRRRGGSKKNQEGREIMAKRKIALYVFEANNFAIKCVTKP